MAAGIVQSARRPARSDRLFYTGMAVTAALVVLVGFAPTYYLRSTVSRGTLPALLQAHGALFSAWIVLMVVQATLIARQRTDVHRALGWVGAALAALVATAGVTAGLATARREAARAFLTIPMFSMVVFAGLVAAAIVCRRRPQAHKRLMLLATISILDAPIARWPGAPGALGVSLLVDLFVVVAMAYDFLSRRRVHPAYIVGGAIIAGNQALRDVVGRSDAWQAVARALIG